MKPVGKRHHDFEPASSKDEGKRKKIGHERQKVIGKRNAEVHRGVFDVAHCSFGFIEAKEGRRVFVMPSSCRDWEKFPPIGAVVSFGIVRDVKTNKDRADNVRCIKDEEVAER